LESLASRTEAADAVSATDGLLTALEDSGKTELPVLLALERPLVPLLERISPEDAAPVVRRGAHVLAKAMMDPQEIGNFSSLRDASVLLLALASRMSSEDAANFAESAARVVVKSITSDSLGNGFFSWGPRWRLCRPKFLPSPPRALPIS
jgi:hypothetical protein